MTTSGCIERKKLAYYCGLFNTNETKPELQQIATELETELITIKPLELSFCRFGYRKSRYTISGISVRRYSLYHNSIRSWDFRSEECQ